KEEAPYAASREFGNATYLREQGREAWGWTWLEEFWQDARFSLRVFVKNPGFSATAVLMLALGIGANTAIFSVVNAVLLRPLPYKDAARLVTVWGCDQPKGFDTDQVSNPDFRDWKSQNHVFENMAASTDAMYTMTGAGEPAAITAYQFSPEFFNVMGVAPQLGRTFLPDEGQAGKNHVVVLSDHLWRERFGGDRGVVGSSVRLDGDPYTVVGVMPPSFRYPSATELWTPLTIIPQSANDRGLRYLRVMARMRPGVTMEQARIEMNTIAARLKSAYPDTNKDQDVNLIGLRQLTTGDIRPALLILLCTAGLVVLIACANVANLLLSRAVTRRKEIAVRAALGASRMRVIRQLLTESVLLGLAGGALGVALAYRGADALVAMFPPTIANLSIPHIEHIPMDAGVLGLALLVSLMTGATFGLVPALEASRLSPNQCLNEGGRSETGSSRGRQVRNALVVAEVALSLILLTAAGLMIKSFRYLIGGDMGFRPNGVLSLRILLPDYKYKTESQQRAFGNEVVERIRSLPGVESVGTVTFLPLSGWWGIRQVSPTRQPSDANAQPPIAIWSSVTPDYFRALGIPLLEGRSFNQQDSTGNLPVVILSAKLARQLWPNEDPIGKTVNVEGLKEPRNVAGVVGEIHDFGPAGEQRPEVYLPFAQVPSRLICVVIRAAAQPASLAASAQHAVWAVDKEQAMSFVMNMDELAAESLAPQRVSMILMAIFAGLALVLATVGIYGVISYSARQRTREIGIRIALGADPWEVLRLVMGEGLLLTIIGSSIGLIGALWLTRYLSSLLYGVRPNDPMTFVTVALILSTVALLASYVPARRAMRADPMAALRHE
ncbi:MAG TPA: ABC transporter permease, partial [Bryobacteraceae bacterium]|nr:ABC transporter permease [Bryobacteraceae bacterium]